MAATTPADEYNMILMLNRDLEAAVKEVVFNDIVKQQLAEFEKKLRPLIKAEVEKMSFKAIDKASAGLGDMMSLRNDLRLYIQWSDDDKLRMLEKVRYVERCSEELKTTILDE